MGESTLLIIALPEELGNAKQLASVLWLNYIQQTIAVGLCELCLLIWLTLKVGIIL